MLLLLLAVVVTSFDTLSIDLERYPIDKLESVEGQALVARCRQELEAHGSISLGGFIKPSVIGQMASEVTGLPSHHRLDIVGPYFFVPGPLNTPPDHPNKKRIAQDVHAVAMDQIPKQSLLRQVYDSPVVMKFLAAALGLDRIFQFDDEFQGVNVMYMRDGGSRAWHYDGSDFVVTLLLQASDQGGEFEFAPFIRGQPPTDTPTTNSINSNNTSQYAYENYDKVAQLFNGNYSTRVSRAAAGTLQLFNGRRSLHRVRAVYGPTQRIQSVLSYDVKPGQKSTEAKNIILYGERVRAIYEARRVAADSTHHPDL